MDIHTTVKTLLSKGTSRRKIAAQLGIHRKVVKRIERDVSNGPPRCGYQREKKLSAHEQQIKDLVAGDWTAELIHRKVSLRPTPRPARSTPATWAATAMRATSATWPETGSRAVMWPRSRWVITTAQRGNNSQLVQGRLGTGWFSVFIDRKMWQRQLLCSF